MLSMGLHSWSAATALQKFTSGAIIALGGLKLSSVLPEMPLADFNGIQHVVPADMAEKLAVSAGIDLALGSFCMLAVITQHMTAHSPISDI